MREVPVKKVSEKLPDGKQRKHIAGDIRADAARGKQGPTSKEEVASKEEVQAVKGPKDLPQLKKKRHLLYKQLQEARQQVPSLLQSSLSDPLIGGQRSPIIRAVPATTVLTADLLLLSLFLFFLYSC